MGKRVPQTPLVHARNSAERQSHAQQVVGKRMEPVVYVVDVEAAYAGGTSPCGS